MTTQRFLMFLFSAILRGIGVNASNKKQVGGHQSRRGEFAAPSVNNAKQGFIFGSLSIRLTSILPLIMAIVLILPAIASAQQKHALLVAVSEYQRPSKMGTLKFPEADAKAIKDVLERADGSGYQVKLLLGREATANAVLAALKEIAGKGEEGGHLILGFFGHGVQYGADAYFCPYDTNLRQRKDEDGKGTFDGNIPLLEPDPATMVSMRDMLVAIRLSDAKYKILLADCCRDDPHRARGGLTSRAFGADFQASDLPDNAAAFFACSKDEKAYELDEFGHGAFTKAFLDAFQLAAKPTANELSVALVSRVEALVKPRGVQQTVRSKINDVVDFGIINLTASVIKNSPEMKRAAASASDALPRTITNSVGAKLMLINPGAFMMGSPESDTDADSDEKPQHRVTLTRPYYLGETELTQEQWKKVMGTEPWKGKISVHEGDNYPATYVSWEDAVAYCQRLSELERRNYRLPTEAEWEYACRAGTSTRFSFGDDANQFLRFGWFNANTATSNENFAHEVKQKLPNSFDLYDMHGNVFEWCGDWYGAYESGSAMDPLGVREGSGRIRRGGCWFYESSECRAPFRDEAAPLTRNYALGFRLLLSLRND